MADRLRKRRSSTRLDGGDKMPRRSQRKGGSARVCQVDQPTGHHGGGQAHNAARTRTAAWEAPTATKQDGQDRLRGGYLNPAREPSANGRA